MNSIKNIIKKRLCLLILFCFFITELIGCGKNSATYFVSDENTEKIQIESTESGESQENKATEIYVHVCGKVVKPGVYELEEDARLCDAIEAAGGYSNKADKEYLNLAEKVTDGQKIYVPGKDEIKENEQTSAETQNNTNEYKAQDSNKVNINTASREELMTISGIGEAKADSIIAYRSENGSFSSIEDIKNVSGIGDGLFSKMKEYITI